MRLCSSNSVDKCLTRQPRKQPVLCSIPHRRPAGACPFPRKQPGFSAEPHEEWGSPDEGGWPGSTVMSEAEGCQGSRDGSPCASCHPRGQQCPFPGSEFAFSARASSAAPANKLTFTAGFRSLIRHAASMFIHLFPSLTPAWLPALPPSWGTETTLPLLPLGEKELRNVRAVSELLTARSEPHMERESLERIAMVIRLQNVCFEQAAPGIVYFQKSREILARENLKIAGEGPRLTF